MNHLSSIHFPLVEGTGSEEPSALKLYRSDFMVYYLSDLWQVTKSFLSSHCLYQQPVSTAAQISWDSEGKVTVPGTCWVLYKHQFLPLFCKKLMKKWYLNWLALVSVLYFVLAKSWILGSNLLLFLKSGSYCTPQRWLNHPGLVLHVLALVCFPDHIHFDTYNSLQASVLILGISPTIKGRIS